MSYPPQLDGRDLAIILERAAALDKEHDFRVGDYVVFADDVTRRISHVYPRREWGEKWGVQTSDGGSWYLGNGYVSFSGSLYPSVSVKTLTLTEERRSGHIWIFHHDLWRAHNGVDAQIEFRVYPLLPGGAEMKAIVIPADASCPARVVDERLTLDYLQGIVGGLIEALNIERMLTDSGMKQIDATVFLNEEGKLLRLPVNARGHRPMCGDRRWLGARHHRRRRDRCRPARRRRRRDAGPRQGHRYRP